MNNNVLKTVLKILGILIMIQLLRFFSIRFLLLLIPFTKFNYRLISSIVLLVLITILIFIIRKKKIKINMFNKDIKEFYLMISAFSIILLMISSSLLHGNVIHNIVIMVYSCILIPVFEELIFRGYIWNKLSLVIKKDFIVYIVSTVLFALWHIGYIDSYILFVGSENLLSFVCSKVLIGLVFGIITGFFRYKCKSTYISILAHSVLNSFGK